MLFLQINESTDHDNTSATGVLGTDIRSLFQHRVYVICNEIVFALLINLVCLDMIKRSCFVLLLKTFKTHLNVKTQITTRALNMTEVIIMYQSFSSSDD